MARPLSVFVMLPLLLAAQQASAQVPVVMGPGRIRLEVRPQVVETDMGEEAVFAMSVGVDGNGAQGAAMLSTPDGVLQMRITDGMVICDDDGLMFGLQAFTRTKPHFGRRPSETELLILITPRIVPSKPGGGDTRNDILIGGKGRDCAFAADGRLQIIGDVPCEEE